MKLKSFGKGLGFAFFFVFSLTSFKVTAQNFFGQPYQHVHDEKCAHALIEKMQEEKMGIYGSKEFFETWINKEIVQNKRNFNPFTKDTGGTKGNTGGCPCSSQWDSRRLRSQYSFFSDRSPG
jgi:hypothetical protein